MIVDDEYAIRDALTLILEDEGYTVRSAINGQDALRQLQQNPAEPLPCVILLDLTMPVMDGLEFKAAQEQDPLLSLIPVIVISADSNLRQKATAIHANEFLPKPVELEKLLDTIRHYCSL